MKKLTIDISEKVKKVPKSKAQTSMKNKVQNMNKMMHRNV
jgi:hypothetical protein